MFAGCAVGPNYFRPTVPVQTGWKEGATTTSAPALPNEWWTIFNDADLNALETRAAKANQDLNRALARVTEARALARVSAAELYPNISANGAYSRNRLSENRANTPQQKLESDDFIAHSTSAMNSTSGAVCGARSKRRAPTQTPW